MHIQIGKGSDGVRLGLTFGGHLKLVAYQQNSKRLFMG
jgi:hypothetical protein